jgi:hypothetical protein
LFLYQIQKILESHPADRTSLSLLDAVGNLMGTRGLANMNPSISEDYSSRRLLHQASTKILEAVDCSVPGYIRSCLLEERKGVSY